MDRYTLIPGLQKLISQFLTRGNSFVVSYDENSSDLMTTIVETLQKNDYQVQAVNIQENPDLSSLSKSIFCLTTPPKDNLKLIKALAEIKINKIWLEPGSESEAVINFCQENNLDLIYYHSLAKEIVTRNG